MRCWRGFACRYDCLDFLVSGVNDVDGANCTCRHCKNIRMSTYILWRVFHILTEPVTYTFVSVNRRNNEARTFGSGLHYSVDLRTQAYTEPVPLKYGKLATKYTWTYGYFTVCLQQHLTVTVSSPQHLLLRRLHSHSMRCPLSISTLHSARHVSLILYNRFTIQYSLL